MAQLTYKIADSTAELAQILALQTANHFSNLNASAKAAQGFVTVQHTLAQLEAMAKSSPQFIAMQGDQVIGYVLSMNYQMKDTVPSLTPLFEELDQFSYEGVPLSKQSFMIGGQTCIDQSFRGMGVMQALYNRMQTEVGDQYTGCITEISDLNQRSLKAHEKMGFETIHRYDDWQQEWHIVLWNWKKKNEH